LGALTRIHGMERGARLAGLIERGPLDVEAARCGGWQALVTPVAVMDRDTADALRPAGLAWVAWRANEPAEIGRALGMGAQGVITARPDLPREGCAPRRGRGWAALARPGELVFRLVVRSNAGGLEPALGPLEQVLAAYAGRDLRHGPEPGGRDRLA